MRCSWIKCPLSLSVAAEQAEADSGVLMRSGGGKQPGCVGKHAVVDCLDGAQGMMARCGPI